METNPPLWNGVVSLTELGTTGSDSPPFTLRGPAMVFPRRLYKPIESLAGHLRLVAHWVEMQRAALV
jgi:hypothetical protein